MQLQIILSKHRYRKQLGRVNVSIVKVVVQYLYIYNFKISIYNRTLFFTPHQNVILVINCVYPIDDCSDSLLKIIIATLIYQC